MSLVLEGAPKGFRALLTVNLQLTANLANRNKFEPAGNFPWHEGL